VPTNVQDPKPVYDEAAPRLWPGAAFGAPYTVPLQRVRSHSLRLSDGHRIGVMGSRKAISRAPDAHGEAADAA